MTQNEYPTADQYWNAGATEIQQLNLGGPYQRQSIEPQPS